MSTKEYRFETKNLGEVTVCVTGRYTDGTADLTVDIEGNGAYEEFCEIDLADDIIEWLLKEGVEFESKRSMLFNCDYITEVMISREASMHEVLGRIDRLTDEEVERRAGYLA